MIPEKRMLRSLDGLTVGDSFGDQFFVGDELFEKWTSMREFPPGIWKLTDDSVMAAGICRELKKNRQVDQDSLAVIFGEIYKADPHRGYGAYAQDTLKDISEGGDWRQLAGAMFEGSGSFGNGGAMRVAPLGAYWADDYDRVISEARKSAEVTHTHPEGVAGAIAVAVAAAWACRQSGLVVASEKQTLFEAVLERMPYGETRNGIVKAAGLRSEVGVKEAAKLLGSGYSVSSQDTVPFVLFCVSRFGTDFEDALWNTVAGEGDIDTTCAMVGGISVLLRENDICAQMLQHREAFPEWLGLSQLI